MNPKADGQTADNKLKVTPEPVYRSRRRFIKTAVGAAVAGGAMPHVKAQEGEAPSRSNNTALKTAPAWLWEKVQNARRAIELEGDFPHYNTTEKQTPQDYASSYNNFYEFGNDKTDPAKHASSFDPHPFRVKVSGEVTNSGEFSLRELVEPMSLEERVYRLRCVEAWSMVIPWIGFPLSALVQRLEPKESARFIEFETLEDKKQMPGVRSFFSTVDWPYREGLRMDEAMHPLAIIAVGMYGAPLPGQNGAPFRLIVPWKYGFKSIKSIVSIRFRKDRPVSSWEALQPAEYGFYANVNPNVSHPRWSQDRERRLPADHWLFANWVQTKMFNGYEEQVAHLYEGMDLRTNY